MRTALTRGFGAFALISGIGWILDTGLTMGLVQFGLTPFAGSLIGAATAVTFVYAVSRMTLLGDRRIGRPQDFARYVAWQIFAIAAASALVALIARLLAPVMVSLTDLEGLRAGGVDLEPITLASGLAKAIVTPVTLLANFLFMKWLTEHQSSVAMDGEGAR
jgi:putative flippase GtrA